MYDCKLAASYERTRPDKLNSQLHHRFELVNVGFGKRSTKVESIGTAQIKALKRMVTLLWWINYGTAWEETL